MRFSLPAIAFSVCVCVSPAGLAAAPPKDGTAATLPAAAPSDGVSDAAARHAKRTACLKQAKAKKLVGTDKNSFIKDCVAAH